MNEQCSKEFLQDLNQNIILKNISPENTKLLKEQIFEWFIRTVFRKNAFSEKIL